ncbi:MAG: biotin/lipoyl-containing protein [Bacteroidota bacterium]
MKLKPRIVEIKVPLLTGEESLMTVRRWLVTLGEQVEIDQDLVELDLDAQPFLLPSPLDGKLIAIEAEAEETVEPGQILALVEAD